MNSNTMKTRSILFLMMMFVSVSLFAQKQTITGTVTDETGEPLIGASVIQKETKQGCMTDLDGNFKIDVENGSTLVFSYLGYVTQEQKAAPGMRVVLSEDNKMLSEVVVVGYGVQKKSVVTASIAKVNSEDLALTAPVRMDNALKGLASGVTVTSSSGQPGAAARIRVRGVGTINYSDPLYIVDGMPIEGGLDYLNPSDIESIEVLKDAASGAVYGARAANGVILVTTKSGKEGRAKVNYNFSAGWQKAWKHRDVLDATNYALMMNEGSLNTGGSVLYDNPYSFGKGTDWQNLVFNDNAPVVNHELSVSGATEKLNYYLSLGYYTQDGIVGGNYGRSNYDRLTLRSNTKYNIFDESKSRNWLNKLDVTVNLSYARTHSTGIETNSTWGSVLGSALALSPIMSPTKNGQEALDEIAMQRAAYSDYVPFYTGRTDANGIQEVYTLPGTQFGEMGNPLALLALPGAKNWSHKFVANFAADLQIWDNLKYRISYGADQSFWGTDSYSPIYYIRKGYSSDKTSASSSSDRGTVWQIENVLTYDKTIDAHTFSVVLGQSAKKSYGAYLNASRDDLISLSKPYIDAALGQAAEGKQYAGGGLNDEATLASLFGRLSYNYDERYMLQATVRRDGSSRFGSNNHYATFPSFSLGWNLTNEPFMEKRPEWLTTTKFRFSWGKNGNEQIGNFRYLVLTSTGNNYIFGRDQHIVNGTKASGLANPNLKWEESTQTDFGVDFGFFHNALTLTIDYYKKRTTGMLMSMNIPNYVGEEKPIGNVGKMDNSGIEFELSYKGRVGNDFKYRVSGNLSYLKNKLVEYGNETGYADYDNFQGTGVITRAENGYPFPFFYGYKTAGIFQNADEVAAWVNSDGQMLQPDAKPGDVRFLDINGDGVLSDEDRTKIGKGMPDWTFGVNLSASYKGFDFSAMLQGTIGNDVFDATRRSDLSAVNLPSWMLDRWTGEGTSDKMPRFTLGDVTNNNWRSSDLYIYDGSYLRLKNIQIGYTLPETLTKRIAIERLRFYVAAENLVTFTKYHGFDPEIASGGTSLGIDYGVYPQAKVWTVGLNIGF